MYIAHFFVFFILPFVVCQENFCEQFCYCASSSVICRGVSKFPTFESTYWIKKLTIYSSSLRYIPPLSSHEFVFLSELNFINCPNINCQSVISITLARPYVYVAVNGDCRVRSTILPTTTTNGIETPRANIIPTTDISTATPSSTSTPAFETVLPSPATTTPLPRYTTATSNTTTGFQAMTSQIETVVTTHDDERSRYASQKSDQSAKSISEVAISLSVIFGVIVILFIAFVCYKVKRRQRRNVVRNISLDQISNDTVHTDL